MPLEIVEEIRGGIEIVDETNAPAEIIVEVGGLEIVEETVDISAVAANAITAHVSDTNNPHGTDIENLGPGTLAELNDAITDATLDDASDPRTPTAHASTHSAGQPDEIDAGDLGSGAAGAGEVLTADGVGGAQWNPAGTPGAHASTHSQGGTDPIDAGDLASGAALDGQVLTADGLGGAGWETRPQWVEDEFSPTNGQITLILSSVPTDPDSFSLQVNGLTYDDVTDYTRSGVTVTWLNTDFTLESGDKVVARYK